MDVVLRPHDLPRVVESKLRWCVEHYKARTRASDDSDVLACRLRISLADLLGATHVEQAIIDGRHQRIPGHSSLIRKLNKIESAWTLATSPVTTEPVSVLEAPTNLELSMLEFTTLRLSWSYAGSDHTGFNIYAAAGDGAMEFLQEAGPTIRLVNLSNFEEGMPYAFVIRAFNDVEESADSNVASGNTQLQHATSVTVSQPAETELEVTWAGGSSFMEGWELERKIDDEPWEYVGSFTPGEMTFSDSGILAGSHYEYRVRAFRADIYSLHNSGGMDTAITAPTNLSVNVVSAREANLSWTDNSQVEEGYRIFYAESGQPFLQQLDVAANARGYTFTSLDPETTYTFSVAAFRGALGAFMSDATATQVVSTPLAPSPLPPQPPPYKVLLGSMERGSTNRTYVSGELVLQPHAPINSGSPEAAIFSAGVITGGITVFNPDAGSNSYFGWSGGYKVYSQMRVVDGTRIFDPLAWDPDQLAYVGKIGLEDAGDGDYDDWTWPVTVYPPGPATIAVSTTDSIASEDPAASDVATFAVRRFGDFSTSLTVDFHPLAGSAVHGDDYIIRDGATQIIPNPTSGQFSVTFASGETEKTLTIEAADDLLDEPLDDVYLYPKGSASYRLATPSTAPAKIASNDTATGDMIVSTVNHNAPGPDLPDAQEMNPGAFLPVNNDDDDYKGGSDAGQKDANNQPVVIDGEDDLLVLKVKKANPAVGEYRLETPAGGFRVFQNPNRTELLNDWFDATQDRELYIEAPKRLIGTIKLSWRRDAKSQPKNGLDEVKLTAFEWKGPLNVPDYSIHRYTVTSPPTGSKWIVAGMQHGTIKSGADSANAQIQWTDGAEIGKAVFQANANFIWDLGVNVVEVKIEAPPNAAPTFVPGHPREAPNLEGANPQKKRIFSGNRNGQTVTEQGLRWSAKITLTGPLQGRGVDKIEVGFVQNVKWSKYRARYAGANGGVDRWLKFKHEGEAYLDKQIPPDPKSSFYDSSDDGMFKNATPNQNTKVISSFDEPEILFPVLWDFQHADTHLKHIDGIWRFDLFVIARTTETASPANGVYTTRAEAKWHWDSSSDIGPAGVAPAYHWTPPTGGGITFDQSWSAVSDGSQPPILTGKVANVISNPPTWLPLP